MSGSYGPLVLFFRGMLSYSTCDIHTRKNFREHTLCTRYLCKHWQVFGKTTQGNKGDYTYTITLNASHYTGLVEKYANNKGARQPAHLHILISAFAIHSLGQSSPAYPDRFFFWQREFCFILIHFGVSFNFIFNGQ